MSVGTMCVHGTPTATFLQSAPVPCKHTEPCQMQATFIFLEMWYCLEDSVPITTGFQQFLHPHSCPDCCHQERGQQWEPSCTEQCLDGRALTSRLWVSASFACVPWKLTFPSSFCAQCFSRFSTPNTQLFIWPRNNRLTMWLRWGQGVSSVFLRIFFKIFFLF